MIIRILPGRGLKFNNVQTERAVLRSQINEHGIPLQTEQCEKSDGNGCYIHSAYIPVGSITESFQWSFLPFQNVRQCVLGQLLRTSF